MADSVCVICGTKNLGGEGLYTHQKFVCFTCQRDIARAYANTHLDPIELYKLIDSGVKDV